MSREEYRFGYQGLFAEKDDETGWNAFELRMYDPVIGRWLSTDPAGQYWSPYVGMGNEPIYGIDPDGAFKWWGGAQWYAMWNGGGTISKNNDGVWQVTQGGGGITQIEGVGNVIDEVSVITARNPDGRDWSVPTVGMARAEQEYWNSLSMSEKIAMTGDPSLDGILPSYPETYLFPTAPLKGLQASRTLYASYKATRTAGGLQIGRKIATKIAVQRLKRNQDVYSNSRSEAKLLIKKAKGSSTVHDNAHGSGYYNHFHDKDRTGGHSFYGSPQN